MAIDFVCKAIHTGLFLMGIVGEVIDIHDDIKEGDNEVAQISKTVALTLRVIGKTISSPSTAILLKAGEAGAKAVTCLDAEGTGKKHNQPAAIAGLVRCAFEGMAYYENIEQEYATNNPGYEVPVYETTYQIAPSGQAPHSSDLTGVPVTYTSKIVGYKPFDHTESQIRQISASCLSDFASGIETIAKHDKIAPYRAVVFDTRRAPPPMPILAPIPPTDVPTPDPYPECPIALEPIVHPARDVRRHIPFYEEGTLRNWVERSRRNPLTGERMTQSDIERIRFTP